MSGAFEDIRLEWDGKSYTIYANNVMRAIARVEDVVTLQELNAFAQRGTAPVAKISLAYASVLEFAGCKVTPAEVYDSMFKEAGSDRIASSVQGLLFMMMPPSLKKLAVEGNAKPEKESAGLPPANASAMSKKPSKRQSRKASGAQSKSSGS